MQTHSKWITVMSTLTVGASLFADVSDAQMRSLESRVSSLEQKKGPNAMVNPPGRPQVRDGADLFFTADWLIWQGRETGLGYVVKAPSTGVTTALNNSSVQNIHFNWDFGFRVGLGYNLPHDGWDISAGWTWFLNNAHGSSSTNSTQTLLPVSGYVPAIRPLAGFRASTTNLSVHLNLIDLDLGREFFVSKWMTLRPFMGVRTGWINQSLDITNSDPTEDAEFAASTMQGKNDFWGIGIRTGMNTQWGLGAGFSLFGNGSFSLLNGFFSVHDYEANILSSGAVVPNVQNQDSPRTSKAIGELAMGIRWDTLFANDHCHFGVQAGWENLIFFNQNQFKHFYGSTTTSAGQFFANQGDLSFQGWTLSIRLDF